MADGKDQGKERERVAARIRALLAKTVENGCTEQEALAAAALAAEWLARHEMDLDEVEMRADPFAEEVQDFSDEVGERLGRVAAAIGVLTGSRTWRSPRGISPVRHHFVGFAHEVEIAGYLLEICARAMRSGGERVDRANALKVPDYRRRQRIGFLDGMADTLRRRILDMVPPRPPGTGLVVLRWQLIDQEMVRRGIELEDLRPRMSRDFVGSYDDGVEEANRVALTPGVRSDRPTAAIGRRS